MFRKFGFVFALLLTHSLLGSVQAQDRQTVHYQEIFPGGPKYGELIEQFFASSVFPEELSYKGIGIRRDTCITEMVESNGRGGYWFRVRARYKGVIGPFHIPVAETAKVHYDNGGIRVDLGGMHGFIDTRSVGRWVMDRFPRNGDQIPPGPPPRNPGAGPSAAPGSIFRTQGTEFYFLAGGEVIETRKMGPPSLFTVQGSGPDFVDLFDRDRQMFVRLTRDRGLFRPAQGGQWTPWQGSEGSWATR